MGKWILALLLLALPARADVAPEKIASYSNQCAIYKMCDAEMDTGTCLASGGDEIVLQSGTRSNMTFYGLQSTASTYTAEINHGDRGHDDSSDDGVAVSTTLTNASEGLSIAGLFGYIWVNLTANAGDNEGVTITVLVCPAER